MKRKKRLEQRVRAGRDDTDIEILIRVSHPATAEQAAVCADLRAQIEQIVHRSLGIAPAEYYRGAAKRPAKEEQPHAKS